MNTLDRVPDISAATSKPAPPSIDELPIYYEDGKTYLVGVGRDKYISMSGSDLRRHLIALGFDARARGEPLSQVEAAIHRVQTTRHISYAGPLAGKSAGLYTVFGKRILVTVGPQIIEPDSSVEWPALREIIEHMLGTEEKIQLQVFYGWLKHAYVSLRGGTVSQGQALALAGPRDCGKSLLQCVIRECLGGREASPYAFMTGRTSFNRELFGAECLMFGDEVASADYRNRIKFGSYIKQFVVNETQWCHGKGREAVTLDPFWRVVMSLNDEQSSLDVLPPMSSDSIADKLTLIKVSRPPLFDRAEWKNNSRPENWGRIMKELPGFLAFLVSYQLPAEIGRGRLGVMAYQNRDLLVTIGAESPDRRLLELIDTAVLYFADSSQTVVKPPRIEPKARSPWRGTAAEMEARLLESSVVSRQASRLLHWDSACGVHLASLAKNCPERVTSLRLREGLNRYEVRPPKTLKPTEEP